MIVVIDNYDSFTYNLVDLLGALGETVCVVRNNATLAELEALNPERLVISPGPGRPPNDTGVTCDAIKRLAGRIPILGVCLGHQAIGHVFGGSIIPASRIMHGKASCIRHDDDPLFVGIANGFKAGRYHSLVIDPTNFPRCLAVIAESDDDQEIMAVRHRDFKTLYGVQFHPESILTASDKLNIIDGAGAQLLKNFLAL